MTKVGFPGLNIGSFELDPIAIHIGKGVYWYGIIIAIGFVCAVLLGSRRAKRMDINQDVVYDLVLWGLPTAIVCARLYYVLGDLSSYSSFMGVIAIWDGGLSIYGAVIGASLVGLVYSKIKKLPMGKVFDMAAPCLMVGQIIGRLGNFMNAEVYGRITTLPWRMYLKSSNPFDITMLPEQGVHPLFLYEQVWMIIGLIGILAFEKHKKHNGEVFITYILWYSLGRAWMEMLRYNEFVLKIFNMPLSFATAIAIVVCAAGALIWMRLRLRKKPCGCAGEALPENSETE